MFIIGYNWILFAQCENIAVKIFLMIFFSSCIKNNNNTNNKNSKKQSNCWTLCVSINWTLHRMDAHLSIFMLTLWIAVNYGNKVLLIVYWEASWTNTVLSVVVDHYSSGRLLMKLKILRNLELVLRSWLNYSRINVKMRSMVNVWVGDGNTESKSVDDNYILWKYVSNDVKKKYYLSDKDEHSDSDFRILDLCINW